MIRPVLFAIARTATEEGYGVSWSTRVFAAQSAERACRRVKPHVEDEDEDDDEDEVPPGWNTCRSLKPLDPLPSPRYSPHVSPTSPCETLANKFGRSSDIS
jgi:hypothetical protein